jgi:glutamyl-tRNA(Gln) amidotransferase subunit D
MEDAELEGYRGDTLRLLKDAGAKNGSTIHVAGRDGFEYSGILIPRYSHADANHIVIKLRSGYNIGVATENVASIRVIRDSIIFETPAVSIQPGVASSKRHVLLLSTGGTIASKVDYRTGAVKPALTAEDLYSSIPELSDIALITPEVIFSLYSENLEMTHWQALSSRIASAENQKVDGIVVMIGTDTMGYTSAALSFALIGYSKTVVFVGSQRSSDRPSSDSAVNLKAAVRFAAFSGSRGVFVAMHENTSDDVVSIHSAVRVRKNHTSRRDAFQSIDTFPVAQVRGDEIHMRDSHEDRSREDAAVKLKTKFDANVALVKFHPGFDALLIEILSKECKMRGLIIEGTGLGHVSSRTVDVISKLTMRGIFVGIASQCIWGRTDLNVYDTGRDLLRAGAVPLDNMLSETALAKLSWALANFPASATKEMMSRNLIGEITPRVSVE